MSKFYNLKKIFNLDLSLVAVVGGHVLFKAIVIVPFNYDEQNGYLETLIGRLWKKEVGRGLAALQSLWSLKKGNRNFIFRLKEPSQDIVGPMVDAITPGEKIKNK